MYLHYALTTPVIPRYICLSLNENKQTLSSSNDILCENIFEYHIPYVVKLHWQRGGVNFYPLTVCWTTNYSWSWSSHPVDACLHGLFRDVCRLFPSYIWGQPISRMHFWIFGLNYNSSLNNLPVHELSRDFSVQVKCFFQNRTSLVSVGEQRDPIPRVMSSITLWWTWIYWWLVPHASAATRHDWSCHRPMNQALG